MRKRKEATDKPKAATISKRKWRYIGPDYDKGIILHNGPTIKPRQMTDEAIDSLLELHPIAKQYFKEA